MNNQIKELRNTINHIDDTICRHLEMRKSVVNRIQEIKDEEGFPERDEVREDKITSRLKSNYPEVADVIEILYNHLFNNAR